MLFCLDEQFIFKYFQIFLNSALVGEIFSKLTDHPRKLDACGHNGIRTCPVVWGFLFGKSIIQKEHT